MAERKPEKKVLKIVKVTLQAKDGSLINRTSVPNSTVRAAASSGEHGIMRKKSSSKRREGCGSDGSNGSNTTDYGSTPDSSEPSQLSFAKSVRVRSRSKIGEKKKKSNEARKNSATEVKSRSKVRRKRKLAEGSRSSPAEKKIKVTSLGEEEEDWLLENEMKDKKTKDGRSVYVPPHARKSEEQAGCCDIEDREFHEAVEQKERKLKEKKPKETVEPAADVVTISGNEGQKPPSPPDQVNAPISKERNKSSQVSLKKKSNVVKANKTTQSQWKERQSRQDSGTDDFYGSSVQPMPTTPQSSNGWRRAEDEGSVYRREPQKVTPIQQKNTTPKSEDSNGFCGTAQHKAVIVASNGQMNAPASCSFDFGGFEQGGEETQRTKEDFGTRCTRHHAPSQLIHPHKVEKLFADAEGVMWIDSHCHLDFIWEQKRDDFETWRQKYHSLFPPTFEGCIPNFIYPELFTRIESMIKKFDRGWIEKQVTSPFVYGATYGCHPHKADLYSEDVHDELVKFCRDKKKYKTIAIGECGLDYYRKKSTKENQKEAFRRQLGLAHDHNLTVVIHCRPAQPDDETEDECLDILQKSLGHYHNIHRHCFPGNKRTAEKWVEQFPNTYFGFTYLIETANDEQKEAIRAISMDRILIETDAPYFRPKAFYQEDGDKTSFPGMAIAAAEVIARYKNLPLAEVLRATRRNVDRCYGLPVL